MEEPQPGPSWRVTGGSGGGDGGGWNNFGVRYIAVDSSDEEEEDFVDNPYKYLPGPIPVPDRLLVPPEELLPHQVASGIDINNLFKLLNTLHNRIGVACAQHQFLRDPEHNKPPPDDGSYKPMSTVEAVRDIRALCRQQNNLMEKLRRWNCKNGGSCYDRIKNNEFINICENCEPFAASQLRKMRINKVLRKIKRKQVKARLKAVEKLRKLRLRRQRLEEKLAERRANLKKRTVTGKKKSQTLAKGKQARKKMPPPLPPPPQACQPPQKRRKKTVKEEVDLHPELYLSQENFLSQLGLVTPEVYLKTQAQSKRTERRRRTTANPKYKSGVYVDPNTVGRSQRSRRSDPESLPEPPVAIPASSRTSVDRRKARQQRYECSVCEKKDVTLQCTNCLSGFHPDCIRMGVSRAPPPETVSVCPNCVTCNPNVTVSDCILLARRINKPSIMGLSSVGDLDSKSSKGRRGPGRKRGRPKAIGKTKAARRKVPTKAQRAALVAAFEAAKAKAKSKSKKAEEYEFKEEKKELPPPKKKGRPRKYPLPEENTRKEPQKKKPPPKPKGKQGRTPKQQQKSSKKSSTSKRGISNSLNHSLAVAAAAAVPAYCTKLSPPCSDEETEAIKPIPVSSQPAQEKPKTVVPQPPKPTPTAATPIILPKQNSIRSSPIKWKKKFLNIGKNRPTYPRKEIMESLAVAVVTPTKANVNVKASPLFPPRATQQKQQPPQKTVNQSNHQAVTKQAPKPDPSPPAKEASKQKLSLPLYSTVSNISSAVKKQQEEDQKQKKALASKSKGKTGASASPTSSPSSSTSSSSSPEVSNQKQSKGETAAKTKKSSPSSKSKKTPSPTSEASSSGNVQTACPSGKGKKDPGGKPVDPLCMKRTMMAMSAAAGIVLSINGMKNTQKSQPQAPLSPQQVAVVPASIPVVSPKSSSNLVIPTVAKKELPGKLPTKQIATTPPKQSTTPPQPPTTTVFAKKSIPKAIVAPTISQRSSSPPQPMPTPPPETLPRQKISKPLPSHLLAAKSNLHFQPSIKIPTPPTPSSKPLQKIPKPLPPTTFKPATASPMNKTPSKPVPTHPLKPAVSSSLSQINKTPKKTVPALKPALSPSPTLSADTPKTVPDPVTASESDDSSDSTPPSTPNYISMDPNNAEALARARHYIATHPLYKHHYIPPPNCSPTEPLPPIKKAPSPKKPISQKEKPKPKKLRPATEESMLNTINRVVKESAEGTFQKTCNDETTHYDEEDLERIYNENKAPVYINIPLSKSIYTNVISRVPEPEPGTQQEKKKDEDSDDDSSTIGSSRSLSDIASSNSGELLSIPDLSRYSASWRDFECRPAPLPDLGAIDRMELFNRNKVNPPAASPRGRRNN